MHRSSYERLIILVLQLPHIPLGNGLCSVASETKSESESESESKFKSTVHTK